MNTLMKSKDDYLNIARIYAAKGNCKKRNYGCVIVLPNGEIVSAGSTRSMGNPCFKCKRRFSRKGHGYDKCPSIHAEQEALVGISIPYGATAFLFCIDDANHAVDNPRPCPTCEKLLRFAGIKEVITLTEVIKL